MDIVVQKFGGTSVSNPEKISQVIKKIENCISNNQFPVVVVSAMGRKGEPYATDSLIDLLGDDLPDLKNLDLLMSCGELISACTLAHKLKVLNIPATALSGWQAGILTNSEFGNAEVLSVDTDKLLSLISQGIVPVVTGFQGANKFGEITTLGRGGSDTTACIIGEALNASVIEIYTDVDGIMTADPKIVANAKLMSTVFYNDVYQMAEYGAKVIHPKAVAIAMRSNIPLFVKNTMSDSPGTLITNRIDTLLNSKKIATSIVNRTKALLTVIFDGSAGMLESDSILLELIANENLDISVVEITDSRKIFLIDTNKIDIFKNLLLSKGYHIDLFEPCSEINIIGVGANQITKIISKTISILYSQNIPLINLSDSIFSVSCLVNPKYEYAAITALHSSFEL